MGKALVISLIMNLFIFVASTVYAGDIAVIVNKENMINTISFKELVKIFKQDKQYWDGKKICLIMPETNTNEKRIVLKKIYNMTDEELKKFWLAMMFRGEIADFPMTLASNEAVKRFVNKSPNAIGFIDEEFLDDTVKVLKIDGKQPKDEGYILTNIKKNEN